MSASLDASIQRRLRKQPPYSPLPGPAPRAAARRGSGARGEGRFARITWDEALDEIADRLAEVRRNLGAEAISVRPAELPSAARS